MDKTMESDFTKYRQERLMKECPVCSDLYHGYRAGALDSQDKIDKQAATIDEIKAKLDKVIAALEGFRDFGTRHDTNPTGQFRECGCFDSFKGDHWQNYIRSQDKSVRDRAKVTLEEINNKN